MTEKKTWTPWPEAKQQPLEDTYIFDSSVKLSLDHQREEAIMRWLNATYPEQYAIEEEVFRRQERGEPLYDSDEQMKASRESDLVKAHYAFRRETRILVRVEVSKDGSIRVLGGSIT